MVTIAIDAMGGDNAPVEVVKGAVKALENKDLKDMKLILVGDKTAIETELNNHTYDKSLIEVIHTTEKINGDDVPTVAIKNKKDSSMVVAINLVKEGKADGVISAGNTGALLTASTMIIGRIKGIKRAALGALLPTLSEHGTILIDAGANVDIKPEYAVQFAIMGSIYMKEMEGISNPTVGLANIGTEEGKGNELTKEMYDLLKDVDNINFTGNAEVRDIADGVADVVVADGFVGNVILKTTEGIAGVFAKELKRGFYSKTTYKIGGLLAKGALKDFKNKFDYKRVGGAPFLGLKGLVVKAHGSSDAYAFSSAIRQCYNLVDKNIPEKIQQNIENYK